MAELQSCYGDWILDFQKTKFEANLKQFKANLKQYLKQYLICLLGYNEIQTLKS